MLAKASSVFVKMLSLVAICIWYVGENIIYVGYIFICVFIYIFICAGENIICVGENIICVGYIFLSVLVKMSSVLNIFLYVLVENYLYCSFPTQIFPRQTTPLVALILFCRNIILKIGHISFDLKMVLITRVLN